MAENNIKISIDTKMTIKMFARNNRIIIKESFAQFCPILVLIFYRPVQINIYIKVLSLDSIKGKQ